MYAHIEHWERKKFKISTWGFGFSLIQEETCLKSRRKYSQVGFQDKTGLNNILKVF